jgi:hypothetical protein
MREDPRAPSGKKAMQTPPFADDLSSRNLDLLNQVRDSVLLPLADDFAAAVDGLGKSLFNLADGAPPAHQKDYLDAIQELRRERESVIARFRAHLAKAWQGLESGRPLSVERTLARGNDLILVGEAELEVRLAARNLAGAIQQQWRAELMRLDRFLGWIAGGLRLDGDTNPVGPEHLGAAVHAAFSSMRLAPRAQVAAVQLCEPVLLAQAGGRYTALEQQLNTLARGLDLPRPRARRRPIPRPGAVDNSDSPDWVSRFFSQWEGAQAEPAAPRADGLDVHAREDRERLPPGLRELLQRARRLRPQRAAAAGLRRPLSPRELMSALSLLQTEPHAGFHEIDQASSLAQGLQSRILAHASMLGLAADSIEFDPDDADCLDLVALLFDALLDQSQLLPELRAELGQLLVPVAKMALLDPRLFVRDSHPVRRLLNMLADACDGNPGESAAELALLVQVRAVAARIVAEFDEHVRVFLLAEGEFGAYYEQYRRRLEIAERRAAEMQRADEKRGASRERAQSQLQLRLQDRSLPGALVAFLRGPWVQQLERILLRQESDGPALKASLALADEVLATHVQALAGQAIEPERLQAMQVPLRQAFLESGQAPAQADASALALEAALGQPATSAPVSLLEAEPPSAIPAGMEAGSPLPEQAPEQIGFDPETVEYFRALELGTWMDFIDRHGSVQAGKLSWISPISGKRMFVSRRGARLCVASPEQLAAMVRLGRLRLHREEDAFYSAMQGVVDALQMPAGNG